MVKRVWVWLGVCGCDQRWDEEGVVWAVVDDWRAGDQRPRWVVWQRARRPGGAQPSTRSLSSPPPPPPGRSLWQRTPAQPPRRLPTHTHTSPPQPLSHTLPNPQIAKHGNFNSTTRHYLGFHRADATRQTATQRENNTTRSCSPSRPILYVYFSLGGGAVQYTPIPPRGPSSFVLHVSSPCCQAPPLSLASLPQLTARGGGPKGRGVTHSLTAHRATGAVPVSFLR